MQVKIEGFDIEWNGVGAKRWGKLIVSYNQNGNSRKQNIMSFKNPDVFKKVQELVGQTVEVTTTKNDKGYDDWTSVSTSTSGVSAGVVNQTAPARSQGNYETKEERAYRQVLIVKQNALTNAVASLTPGAKTPPSTEDITKRAQELSDWVLANDDADAQDNLGDIPF